MNLLYEDMRAKYTIIYRQQQALLEDKKSVYENRLDILKGIKDKFSKLADLILTDDNLGQDYVESYYPTSTLDIEDKEYNKATNSYISIRGGCGLNIDNITLKEVKLNSQALEAPAIKAVLASDKLALIHYEGDFYSSFSLELTEKEPISELDDAHYLTFAQDAKTIGKEEMDFLQGKQTPANLNRDAVYAHGNTLAHEAARLDNVKALDVIVNGNIARLQVKDDDDQLPIHAAASNGSLQTLQYCLDKWPAGLEARTQYGSTPLMLAVQAGLSDTVTLLVARNADVNARLPNGFFLLYLAILSEFQQMTLTLLEKASRRINVNFYTESRQNALHVAVELNQVAVALQLIKMGADAAIKRTSDGFTALHLAAKKGQIDICMAILDLRGNANRIHETLESGKTPLHLAVENGHFDLVKILIEKYKANVNLAQRDGKLPLVIAIENIHFDIAMIIADKCAINADTQNILLLAGKMRAWAVAEKLIARGADPKKTNADGISYVFYLLQFGQMGRYQKLLQTHSIDPTAEFSAIAKLDHKRKSSAAILLHRGHMSFMYWLVANGGSIKYNNQMSDWRSQKAILKQSDISWVKSQLPTYVKEQKDKLDRATFISPIQEAAFTAAKKGNYATLKMLLQELTPEEFWYNDKHFLAAAIQSGKKRVIELILLQDPLCINRDLKKKGISMAAFIAAKYGHAHLLEFLLRHGLQLENWTVKGSEKTKDLHFNTKPGVTLQGSFIVGESYGLVYGEKEIVKIKTAFGKLNINHDGVVLSVKNYSPEIWSELLRLIPKENWPVDLLLRVMHHEPRNERNQYLQVILGHQALEKFSPKALTLALQAAAQKNDLAMVKMLLKVDADPMGEIYTDDTYFPYRAQFPLFSAVMHDNVELLNVLLDHCLERGSLFQFRSVNREDILSLAIKYRREAVLQVLCSDKLMFKARRPMVAIPTKALEAFEYSYLHPENYQNFKNQLLAALLSDHEQSFKEKFAAFPLKETAEASCFPQFTLFKKDNKNQPLIFYAFEEDCKWAIKFLLQESRSHYPAYLATTDNGVTLFHRIAAMPEEKGIKWLNYIQENFPEKTDWTAELLTKNSQGLSPFDTALKLKNLWFIKKLFNKESAEREVTQHSDNYLHLAVKSGMLELVDFYLDVYWIHTRNALQETPLMLAAQLGQKPIVERLLEKGASANHTNINGNTAFHLAIQNGHHDIALLLFPLVKNIHAKNKDGRTPLMLAALKNNLIMVKLLSRDEDIERYDNQSNNALHLAIKAGAKEVVLALIQFGFDVNAPQKKKNPGKIWFAKTPIQLAAETNHNEIFHVLHEKGAKFTEENAAGLSAIDYALQRENRELALTVCGMAESEDDRKHIWFRAATQNFTSVTRELLLINFNIQTINKEGLNALHLAALSNSFETALVLIAGGIDLHLVDPEGETPLHMATKSGSLLVARCLIRHGLDVNAKNKSFKTPLHLAAEQGDISVVKLLIVAKADCHCLDISKRTALDIAKEKGHTDIVKHLTAVMDKSAKQLASQGLFAEKTQKAEDAKPPVRRPRPAPRKPRTFF